MSIWDGVNLHHSDIRQLFCGNAMYSKEYSPAAVDVVYSDGTTDMKEVTIKEVYVNYAGN